MSERSPPLKMLYLRWCSLYGIVLFHDQEDTVREYRVAVLKHRSLRRFERPRIVNVGLKDPNSVVVHASEG